MEVPNVNNANTCAINCRVTVRFRVQCIPIPLVVLPKKGICFYATNTDHKHIRSYSVNSIASFSPSVCMV